MSLSINQLFHSSDDIRQHIKEWYESPEKKAVVDAFHKMYYEDIYTWRSMRWGGYAVLKSPMDLMTYHDIIFQNKPDLIIETGTAFGGSAYFFATVMDMLGQEGKIVTIDIEKADNLPDHKRIHYLNGSSVDLGIIKEVESFVKDAKNPMVVLDSEHSVRHVREELARYHGYIQPEGFLIVEDTNLGWIVELEKMSRSPLVLAVQDFLKEHTNFTWEPLCERHLLSFAPYGWLRRIN